MMSWLVSLFHFHQWTRWGKPIGDGYQVRECKTCGRQHTKKEIWG